MGKSIAGWALEMPQLLSAPHPNRFGEAGNRMDLCPYHPHPQGKALGGGKSPDYSPR